MEKFFRKVTYFLKITGIICEYNPLHLGHKKQIDKIRQEFGDDTGIVCLMSGQFVQRGEPAIFDKMCRAKAAILAGADLVLELPVTSAISSAEGFAEGGVSILAPFCDHLSFGAETTEPDQLMHIAQLLLSDDFKTHLRRMLDTGISFPAARQAALAEMGADSTILELPNNILAVEYCKAILRQKASMQPCPIHRDGDYHSTEPNRENPSATALRQCFTDGNWIPYVPEEVIPCYQNAVTHTLSSGERAILSKLRCMSEDDFSQVPYGSEGLWRKFMHAVNKFATIDEIIDAVKSKRYTRSRIQRMILCAFLGITENDLNSSAPYVRVLAFDDRGREILNKAKQTGTYVNIGEKQVSPYQVLENRCSDLYGLFADNCIEAAGLETQRRVYYHK